MEAHLIDKLILLNGSKLPEESLSDICDMLKEMNPQTAHIRFSLLKDPIVALLLSIFVGNLGIDRIYAGDTALGILKLLTCGGLSIWWLVDIFLIMDTVRQKNYQTIVYGISC